MFVVLTILQVNLNVKVTCGVLTIDIERVDVATLEKLECQGVDCEPKASTIRIIQDKYLQKIHFSQHTIIHPRLCRLIILRMACDGHGNAVANSEEELSSAIYVSTTGIMVCYRFGIVYLRYI
ncbi:phosphoribosylaminoimidazole carboxylase, chloroplastic [Nicotiana attenuata]|uniref:Phosphoribosylaminoimidazole carboxylase, chloroplastic n=1 Tax=Nicotiana attenuata TaxID=49451 RepID=A0A1J6INQ2_NICAT|nr:phosphoribosylaminoimidazole carboxylase, chloroplastic [Nicotiana attenuata]